MANLIITIISIALVAVAALMGAYYGGRAFMAAKAKAMAVTLVNQAEQITNAWTAYATDHGGSFDVADIDSIGTKYLASKPMIPGEIMYDPSETASNGYWRLVNLNSTSDAAVGNFNGVWVWISAPMQYTTDLSVEVCKNVSKIVGGESATPTDVTATAGDVQLDGDIFLTERKFDCVFFAYGGGVSGLPEAGDVMAFYYKSR